MRKHLVIGVLALALILVASGAYSLYAGSRPDQTDANSKCSVLVDGSKGACTNTAKSCDPSSAGCDPSQCGSMTPEQCAAKGCQPGQCAGSGGCSAGARMIKAATTTSASGCGSAPCAPSPGCGTGSGCASSVRTGI